MATSSSAPASRRPSGTTARPTPPAAKAVRAKVSRAAKAVDKAVDGAPTGKSAPKPPARSTAKKKTKGAAKTPQHTLVLLVRHGQTPTTGATLPGRAPGLHLADTGIAQAEAAAARIGSLTGVQAVYTSPLERTRETAAPIGRAVGQRVRTNRGLLECEFGEWTGAKLSDLRKLPEWRTVQNHPSGFRFPGGESFSEMQLRMVTAVERIAADHRGGTVVAVSHADTIKAVAAHALGTHLDLFQRIVISPCSITALLVGPSGPIVLAVNSTGDDLSSLVPS